MGKYDDESSVSCVPSQSSIKTLILTISYSYFSELPKKYATLWLFGQILNKIRRLAFLLINLDLNQMT